MTERTLKKVSYSVLVGPAVFIYAAAIIFPVIFSIILSFTDYKGVGVPNFVFLDNYIKMFKDEVFLHGLRNNLWIVIVSVFGQLPLGFILAYILYRKLVRGKDFFEAMIFFPITISVIVVAILFNRVFSTAGLLPWFMRKITGNPRWVLWIQEDKTFAIFPILFVILWMYTGLYMIMFLANMQKISNSVIEAAIIDGAKESQILFRIVLPYMLGMLFTTSVFAISGSFRAFGLIYAMTGGGPSRFTDVIAIYLYRHTFKYYKYGFGAAVSVVIIILSVVVITIVRRVYSHFDKKFN